MISFPHVKVTMSSKSNAEETWRFNIVTLGEMGHVEAELEGEDRERSLVFPHLYEVYCFRGLKDGLSWQQLHNSY